MAEDEDPAQPTSLILMNGPIDTQAASSWPTRIARSPRLFGIEHLLLDHVPAGYPGVGRQVYPGHLQLLAFLGLHPRRHAKAHADQVLRVAAGADEAVARHRAFYDEFLAVMDVPGQLYTDTVDQIFRHNLLARGEWLWRGRPVRPERITLPALMTIEGERDDIALPGQTVAAHRLSPAIPDHRRRHLTVADAGHYGVFSGRAWAQLVRPDITRFVAELGAAQP